MTMAAVTSLGLWKMVLRGPERSAKLGSGMASFLAGSYRTAPACAPWSRCEPVGGRPGRGTEGGEAGAGRFPKGLGGQEKWRAGGGGGWAAGGAGEAGGERVVWHQTTQHACAHSVGCRSSIAQYASCNACMQRLGARLRVLAGALGAKGASRALPHRCSPRCRSS